MHKCSCLKFCGSDFALPPTNPPQLDILQNRESDSSLWPTHASQSLQSHNLVFPKVLSEARSPHHFQSQKVCGRPTSAVSVRVLPELLNLFGWLDLCIKPPAAPPFQPSLICMRLHLCIHWIELDSTTEIHTQSLNVEKQEDTSPGLWSLDRALPSKKS